ncbi:hypothetical protein [Streptomyces sp. HUAS ZL42]|uniref:hypothetical protein n=1 Tax=Streptomyces sp. HUAS ZL42 TaxID=3231715 RepID=UPI00345ED472
MPSANADDHGAYLNSTTDYTYDPVNRLFQSVKTGTGAGTETYVHDANANVVTQTIKNVTTNCTYDRNRLLSSSIGSATNNYNYDPYGRLDTVVAGGKVVEDRDYDGFDHVVKNAKLQTDGVTTKTSTYVFDPLERTASKTEGGKTTDFRRHEPVCLHVRIPHDSEGTAPLDFSAASLRIVDRVVDGRQQEGQRPGRRDADPPRARCVRRRRARPASASPLGRLRRHGIWTVPAAGRGPDTGRTGVLRAEENRHHSLADHPRSYVAVCGGWVCRASSHRRSTASDRVNSTRLMITTQIPERNAAKNPTIGTSASTPSTRAAQATNGAKKRRPRKRATPLADRKVASPIKIG